MSPEDIARAFVACSGFTWLPGMRVVEGARCVEPSDSSGRQLWVFPDGETCRVGNVLSLLDTTDACSLDVIAGSLLRAAWPGHSVQVETFPDGTARVLVFDASFPTHHELARAFAISHEPVAVSLLRALEAAAS